MLPRFADAQSDPIGGMPRRAPVDRRTAVAHVLRHMRRHSHRYTFGGYAAWFEAFVTQLELGRFVLYLHDFGSPIGSRLAIKKPERLSCRSFGMATFLTKTPWVRSIQTSRRHGL